MPRVLIADDSPTARELIDHILRGDPEMEVVGHAENGAQAVQMTEELRPDVVTMDIHMPRMSGLEATQEIMSKCPTPIVIVSASTLVNDVQWAMRALQAGALTLLLKPPGPADPQYHAAAKDLLEKVKAMAGVKVVRRRPRPGPVTELVAERADRPSEPVMDQNKAKVVAIATSTGGPPALQQVLAGLPPNFEPAVMVVQHIVAGFTQGFVTWLNSVVPLTVKVAEGGEPLRSGTVYVAPEDRHLGLSPSGRIQLSSAPPIAGFRPSATHLFRSVAEAIGPNAVGVILTGMGSDGVEGLEVLREKGGHVIAQDEATSVIYGMPGVAKEAGVVHRVVPLDQVARAVLRVV